MSFTLMALALSFTVGESIQIMVLLLGNNESSIPTFGYVLPSVLAGIIFTILFLAWVWWFNYDLRWLCSHLCRGGYEPEVEAARRRQHFEDGFLGTQY